jgi:hypothetical protein
MTRYTPLWQQNSSYPASVDRGLIATLWPTSGSTGGPAAAVAGTMNISVPAGAAAVALTTAANLLELCRWDAAEVVTLTASPPSGQSRIDLVVLQVRDSAVDAGSNNDFLFQAVAGVPTTGTPVVPAAPTNAYPICQVLVPGAVANLNTATVTDVRPGAALAVPGVAAAQYNPAAQGSLAIGAGNFVLNAAAFVTFTAPPSGRVYGRWSAMMSLAVNAVLNGAFATNPSGAQIGSQDQLAAAGATVPVTLRVVFEQLYTGLTPGQSYSFWPVAYSANSAVTTVYYGGSGTLGVIGSAGPITMAIQPA